MITDHINPTLAFEPVELQALQAAFNGLKTRLDVTASPDKAALAMLLISAFNSSRDIKSAERIAGERFADLTPRAGVL